MLVQATAPRILLKAHEYPKYIIVHTLAKRGVSNGSVIFGAYTIGGRLPPGSQPVEVQPQGSQAITPYRKAVSWNSDSVRLNPQQIYPIEGEEGFEVLEYALPFWELFRPEDMRRNLALVPFCSGGFSVTARSAFRAEPRTYDERTFTFIMLMPVTGGGIVRLGDSMIDVGNPTFDPWAPNPKSPYKNLEMTDTYNRIFRLGDKSAIDERRAARIRAAEASMAAESGHKALPEKT